MDWIKGQECAFAYGDGHGYLVAVDPTGVRLSRFSISKVNAGLSAGVALEAVRNVIIFPLGRGPGRPGGEPELAALAAAAQRYAERFEAGESLEGYPSWQQPRSRLAREVADLTLPAEGTVHADADAMFRHLDGGSDGCRNC